MDSKAIIQEEQSRLKQKYDSMANSFHSDGLNVESISGIVDSFIVQPDGEVQAKHYADKQIPPNCVRLLVLPLVSDVNNSIIASEAVEALKSTIPAEHKMYINGAEDLHITMYHTSHPHDVRLEPTSASCQTQVPPQSPCDDYLKIEQQQMLELCGQANKPVLRLHDIVLTNTGTLLMLYVDDTENITKIRQRCREVFPGGCSKQSDIIHSTLCRIVTPIQLSKETIQAIQIQLRELAQKYRGTEVQVKHFWYCIEKEYSNIRGLREPMHFMNY